MFGCLRRLGCLAIIIAALGAWYFYTHLSSNHPSTTRTAGATAHMGWEPLTQANAERGRAAVESLSQRTGPVFANMTPSQAASYIFLAATRQLPPSAQKIEAMAVNDRLRVRAEVSLKDFGG